MTVIASYDHYGCGVVIGDILITGPANISKRRPSTHLPTLGHVSSTSDAPPGLLNPEQKVCIITDYCAIAWAGRLKHARQFIARLARLSRRVEITVEVIGRLFVKYSEIKIVGAIYEDERLRTFGFDCEQISCPTLGQIHAAGSGASVIHEYVRTLRELHRPRPQENEIGASAASIALSQVAHLLNAESRKGIAADSIKESFGGGYEIAVFYEGKFNKLSANFVFLDVSRRSGNLKIGNPALVISQSYVGTTLRFRALSTRGPYDDRIKRNETIEVPPFFPRAAKDSFPAIDPARYFTCFVFVDNFRFGGKALISTVFISSSPPFKFSVVNSKLNIDYFISAAQYIKEFLMRCYAGGSGRNLR